MGWGRGLLAPNLPHPGAPNTPLLRPASCAGIYHNASNINGLSVRHLSMYVMCLGMAMAWSCAPCPCIWAMYACPNWVRRRAHPPVIAHNVLICLHIEPIPARPSYRRSYPSASHVFIYMLLHGHGVLRLCKALLRFDGAWVTGYRERFHCVFGSRMCVHPAYVRRMCLLDHVATGYRVSLCPRGGGRLISRASIAMEYMICGTPVTSAITTSHAIASMLLCSCVGLALNCWLVLCAELLAHSVAERQRIENMRARGICFVHGGNAGCQSPKFS